MAAAVAVVESSMDAMASLKQAYTLSREDVLFHLRELGYAGSDISDAFIEECIRDFNARQLGSRIEEESLDREKKDHVASSSRSGIGHEVSYSTNEEAYLDEDAEWATADGVGWDVRNDSLNLAGDSWSGYSTKTKIPQIPSKTKMTEREVAAILDEEEEDIIRCFNSGTKPFLRGGYEDELNLQGEVFMRTPNTSTQKMKSTMRPAEFSYTEDDEIDAVEFYSDTVGEKHIYSHESMNTRESENAPRSRMLRKKRSDALDFHKKASDESDDDGFGAHEIKEFDDYDDHDYDRKIFAGSPNRLDKVINKLASLDLTEVRKQIERQKQKLRKAIATAKQENGGIPRQRSRESSTSWSMASEVSYSNRSYSSTKSNRPASARSGFIRPPDPPKRKKHDPVARFHQVKAQWDNDRFVNRLHPKNTKITISKSDVPIIPPRPRHNLSANRSSYVIPSDKLRKEIIWDVRSRLSSK